MKATAKPFVTVVDPGLHKRVNGRTSHSIKVLILLNRFFFVLTGFLFNRELTFF